MMLESLPFAKHEPQSRSDWLIGRGSDLFGCDGELPQLPVAGIQAASVRA